MPLYALLLTPLVWAWPADDEWQPIPAAGAPMVDAVGDVAGGAGASFDLVSDEAPVAYWWVTGDSLYLRMRLDADPLSDGAITGARGWLIELDGDLASWDAYVALSGPSFYDGFNRDNEPGFEATVDSKSSGVPFAKGDLGRVVEAGSRANGYADAFVDVAIPWSALPTSSDTLVRVLPATSQDAFPATPSTDVGNGDATAGLDALWSDPLDPDADDDGLPTPLEQAYGTDPENPDTDGGGMGDGDEDFDADGRVGEWETDPRDPADDADSDDDGIADVVEERCTLAGTDDDRDADGWDDEDEATADPDGDGLPAFCDADDDNDGVPSATEGTGDTDRDGLGDALDTDADGDGLADGTDGTDDVDCDGAPAFQDAVADDGPCADPDVDGLTNEVEVACGSDPYTRDSDGDGRDDVMESCDADVDCDLLPDRIDGTDDDGYCTDLPEAGDTACVDADPDDAWHDCPGEWGGGGGCTGCAAGGGDTTGAWLLLGVVALAARRHTLR